MPRRRLARWFTRNPSKRAAANVMRDYVEPFARLAVQATALLGRAVGWARLLGAFPSRKAVAWGVHRAADARRL